MQNKLTKLRIFRLGGCTSRMLPAIALLAGVLALAACGSDGSTGAGGCSATDHFDYDGTDYIEVVDTVDSTVCDPQVRATNFTGSALYNITVHFDWNPATKVFANFLSLNIYGDAPGPFTIGDGIVPGSALASVVLNGAALPVCTWTGGALTLTSVGAEGEPVSGSYNLTNTTGLTCPVLPTSGTFSATREPDSPF